MKRTNELNVIGLAVATKVYPWMINEMEEWAHYTTCKPEKNRMYFIAHCQKSPNLFKKYNVEYFYEVSLPWTFISCKIKDIQKLCCEVNLC